jgi:peroxiredoxin
MMLTALASLALGQGSTLPPAVGEKAPPFEVPDLTGKTVRLAPLLKQGPVVLVVLRGYPGYQCPFCTRQVGELMQKSGEFESRKARVVLVYPGPSEGLTKYAGEFVAGKEMPKNFRFAMDPGYRFTQSYRLRWDAPNETAYPSAFVIARDGRIAYAKVSREHGGRAPVTELISALDKLSK